ncbi:MAG: adenylate/guanylate cyclase domain-containing protein [Candidatus Eremiobacteraeota bacterium]|nr:adenylate/guanylate cyclase domain-containing protein [Candidatus Eremiobacteraeota bacterium]
MTTPSGTVTFLFTDIEGSTSRWEAHRDAMQAAVARHDELMRAAVERHRGYVFKTMGDAFCCAFSNPHDAVAAAVDSQQALGEQDWSGVDGLRVRMAIHSGVAELRDDDYFGPPLNRVARLLAAAHGEQVVVSQAAAAIASGTLPAGVALRDLGKHRLKDLPEAEKIFQLTANGLRSDFPPLRAVDENPTNLPLHLTELLGRERELADIETLLGESRLVTLTGSGGVGKTRTALQAAFNALGSFGDGAWLVELATVSDASLLPNTIASALRLDIGSSARPPSEELAFALKEKTLLVILDNCEHLVAGAAQLVEQLLHRCPHVRFLATSREALGVHGERTYRMPSLDEATSIALFAERARAVKRDFSLDGSGAIVAQIVARLDGIPLAIELAASRAKILSVERIREGLNERFKLLAGGSRTALPRQQTLSAMIGWSYELLDDAEKRMFRQLAIFRGAFTLEATAAIGASDEWDALPLLESLVEKSLVVALAAGDESRYRMLESTREFARERLREAGEYDDVAARHCRYFLERSECGYGSYWRTNLDRWQAEMGADADNYRAAIEWAIEGGHNVRDGAAIEANVSGMGMPDGLRLLERAESLIGEDAPQLLRARLALAHARRGSDEGNVYDTALRAAKMFERLGDRIAYVEATQRAVTALWRLGRVAEAVALGEPLIPIANELGEPHLIAVLLGQLGYFIAVSGDGDRGRRMLEEAIARLRALDDRARLSYPLGYLADALFSSGDSEGAVARMREVLELDEEITIAHAVMMDRLNMAAYLLATGCVAESESYARQALETAASRKEMLPLTVAVGHFAQINAENGRPERAAMLVGFADAAYAGLKFPREPTEARGYERTMQILRAALDAERLQTLLAEGARLSEGDAVREALLA